MSGLLSVRGLVVRYGSGSSLLTAVDGIDLDVPAGGTLGLVGESGCGKSTIAKALVGLVPAFAGAITLDGQDFTAHSKRSSREWRRRVQMVFQDPYSSLNPRMTVGEMLQEATRTRTELRSGSARKREAARLLELVGMPADSMDRFPHQFSGGQRQRVAIARALAVNPEVIVADEITSALDVSVQATILNLMQELQREFQLSLLFISHDLSVIRSMSDQISVMYLGRVVESADSQELFERPRHPYTQTLIASIPTLETERRRAPLSSEIPDPRNPPSGCRFHTRCPIGPAANPDRSVCSEQDPALSGSGTHLAACHFAGERVPQTGASKDLSVSA